MLAKVMVMVMALGQRICELEEEIGGRLGIGSRRRCCGRYHCFSRGAMPTYKTSGSQCAVDVEEADGVLERTLLKRGISGRRHGGRLREN